MVDLAVTGLSDKEIARRLAISDHTVGNHFRAIYERLGVSKRSQLIALLKSSGRLARMCHRFDGGLAEGRLAPA